MSALTPAQIAAAASGAGFRGDALTKAVAIALAESGGNPRAHNPVPPDNSYGLWQINMLGSLGPARRRQFGLTSNEQLYDPATNARAAWAISNSGRSFTPWSTYTSGAYLAHMGKAKAATGSSSSGGTVWVPGIIPGLPGIPVPIGPGVPDPGGVIGGIGDGVLGGADALLGGLDAVGAFFGALAQRGTWVRVLQVAGGVALIIGGVVVVGHGVVGEVAGAVVPQAKAAGAVVGAVAK